ncbi:unnamed protein product [Diplocarpon coronariae]|nr:hypothetical protein JHW43_009059 [Diplocarpon mali]
MEFSCLGQGIGSVSERPGRRWSNAHVGFQGEGHTDNHPNPPSNQRRARSMRYVAQGPIAGWKPVGRLRSLESTASSREPALAWGTREAARDPELWIGIRAAGEPRPRSAAGERCYEAYHAWKPARTVPGP